MDPSATNMSHIDLDSEVRRLHIEPRPNERVFEIIPKHMSKVFITLIGAATLSVILVVLFLAFLDTSLSAGPTMIFLSSVIGALYVALIAFCLSQWYAFKHSALIFTNLRIIHTDYHTMFNRRIEELDIHAVLNANGREEIGMGQFFNYGDLTIERIGQESVTIHNIPFPMMAAEQTMHFHNLVAHSSVGTAHNFSATNLAEDKTQHLQNIMNQAEKAAQDQGAPPPAQPTARQPQPGQSGQAVKVMNFKAPSDKLGKVLNDLQTEKEPLVNYLAHQDMFEVEAIILDEETEHATQQLKSEGISEIKQNGMNPQ